MTLYNISLPLFCLSLSAHVCFLNGANPDQTLFISHTQVKHYSVKLSKALRSESTPTLLN